ncbi:MAG: mechanosensitive ion channel, partial [Deltaproteobacteria bacterium]|nr:mechanosensitive ion channel [Deltaproteobacteria bacterium]
MFTSGLVFNLTTMVGIAVKVGIILASAIALNIIQKKLIPRVIIASISNVRAESQDQLATRSKTMAYVFIKVIAVIIWIISIVMVLGVIEVNISPLLATLGVASLGLGFAVQNIIRDYLQGFFIVMEDWYRIGDWVTI